MPHLNRGDRYVEILVASEKRQIANVVRVATAQVVGEMGGCSIDGTCYYRGVQQYGGSRTYRNGCLEAVGRGILERRFRALPILLARNQDF